MYVPACVHVSERVCVGGPKCPGNVNDKEVSKRIHRHTFKLENWHKRKNMDLEVSEL